MWSTSTHQHIKILGGNANILGGSPTIKKVITRWSGTVISRLQGWPVSVGVAHTEIEGLVVNRLVFRCCVNVPSDVQISSVTGSICRVYSLVFGLAPNTPRACIVSILGRAAPDYVLWVTVINELFKSLNGPNALLAQSAWAHWSSPCLHRFDSDSQRIQSRLQSLGIQLRKLGSGQGAKWCVEPPRGDAFPTVLYIFGDASLKDCLGGSGKDCGWSGSCVAGIQCIPLCYWSQHKVGRSLCCCLCGSCHCRICVLPWRVLKRNLGVV